MTEVDVIGLSNYYGDLLALDNVSVAFGKEKITAIIGRSGSGKSTLLKSINGLIQPSSGKVVVAGHSLDYNNINPHRHRIGYVVQGNGLFPHLTVAENISLPGKISHLQSSHGLHRLRVAAGGARSGRSGVDPSRVNDLLTFTGLPSAYADKYPLQLSGGEQQRVAICRALYLNPPVLLMDEPFASLDTLTRRDLHQKMLELRRTYKLTMIIVTHDVSEATRLADDLLVLERGRVQQFGSREEVISKPANPFVKDLLEAHLN